MNKYTSIFKQKTYWIGFAAGVVTTLGIAYFMKKK